MHVQLHVQNILDTQTKYMFIITLVMQHCRVAYHHLYFLGTQISLHASVYIKNILIDLSPNRAIQGQ